LDSINKALGWFDERVWLLLFAMLVFRFGQGLYFPFSTIYFHNVLGIPLPLVGVGLAFLAAASVVSGLISGPLADRFGRRLPMLLAIGGSAVSFLLFSVVDGLAGYLAVSALAGLLGSAMFDAARNAMVADVTPPERRSRAYGLVRVGGNVGWALGPMTAGLVSTAGGGTGGTYRMLFTGTAILSALVLAALAIRVEESLPGAATASRKSPTSGLREALSDVRLLVLLGSGVLLYYVFTQDWQTLPIYARNFVGIPDGKIGLFLGANGVMVILLQLPVSYVIDRISKVVALLAGAVLFALSSTTLLFTDSFLGILIAFAGFFTLAEMILEVAGPALAANLAPVRLRGTYLALFGSCFGVSYGLSPIVAGALLQARLPDVIWTIQLVAAAMAIIGLAALTLLRKV
jgi:MFS family permease